jgi:hypothetical protein
MNLVSFDEGLPMNNRLPRGMALRGAEQEVQHNYRTAREAVVSGGQSLERNAVVSA